MEDLADPVTVELVTSTQHKVSLKKVIDWMAHAGGTSPKEIRVMARAREVIAKRTRPLNEMDGEQRRPRGDESADRTHALVSADRLLMQVSPAYFRTADETIGPYPYFIGYLLISSALGASRSPTPNRGHGVNDPTETPTLAGPRNYAPLDRIYDTDMAD